MSKHLSGKIHASEMNRKASNVRPVCPKCRGLLIPEILLAGDGETRVVVSVGCVNCGERYFRAHQRHRPDATERNAHKLAGRPVINGRGMI